VWARSESLLSDGRTSDVPGQALQLLPIIAMHPLATVQIDPPHLRHRQVWRRSVFSGLDAFPRYQSQRRLPCPFAADPNAHRGSAIAGSECGVLELHLRGLGVSLIDVETASMLPQNHLDAISDAASDLSRF